MENCFIYTRYLSFGRLLKEAEPSLLFRRRRNYALATDLSLVVGNLTPSVTPIPKTKVEQPSPCIGWADDVAWHQPFNRAASEQHPLRYFT